ncbi:hypothetical protein [Pseudoalteromonas sp. S558]|uniref:hypothetical protein n=1 Tax=Pseudoalteromonas sp. S558 TaxID=2066515 RepID=UPI00110AFFAD|nr:hypothetical protein [Pseudoalteromonas sp. S558]TMO02540.1 hypothetical protein CWB66_13485 [Pseudoalteromonas sp. S558]
MASDLLFMCVVVGWLLLTLSIFLTLFSRFKHTKFKQHLFRFLNVVLLLQTAVGVIYLMNTSDNSVIGYWSILASQVICNLLCYMSVKRRIAKIKPSLDYFSMD